jgi:hypothetical protein
MKAIAAKDLEQVLQVLDEDPEAAKLPFFDHNWEEPVAYALRCGCGDDIVEVLLERGAPPPPEGLPAPADPAGQFVPNKADDPLAFLIGMHMEDMLADFQQLPPPPVPDLPPDWSPDLAYVGQL